MSKVVRIFKQFPATHFMRPLLFVLFIFVLLTLRLTYLHHEYNKTHYTIVAKDVDQAAALLKVNPAALRRVLGRVKSQY